MVLVMLLCDRLYCLLWIRDISEALTLTECRFFVDQLSFGDSLVWRRGIREE